MIVPPPPFLNKREKVKTVFGTYDIAEDSVDVNISRDTSVYDYILRDPQYKSLQNEIAQATNESMIQFNPQGYLVAKKADLKTISEELQTKLAADYKMLLEQSFTQSEAKKKALEQSAKRKDLLMEIHKRKFPKDVDFFKKTLDLK